MSPKRQALIHFLLDWYQGIYSKSTINCYLRQNRLPSSSLILAVHSRGMILISLTINCNTSYHVFSKRFPPPWGLINCLYYYFPSSSQEDNLHCGGGLIAYVNLGLPRVELKVCVAGCNEEHFQFSSWATNLFHLGKATWRCTRELKACIEVSYYLGICLL